MLSDQIERYSRQIKLPQVGETGQQQLLDARVLIIGMGGLGSPVAMYLAAAGVGHLVISDYDRVDESNLQRQIVHTQASINELKAASARDTLLRLNPAVSIDALNYELDDEELTKQVKQANVVVDCTDNFPSRFELNGSASRLERLSSQVQQSDGKVRYQPLSPRTRIAPAISVYTPTPAWKPLRVPWKASSPLSWVSLEQHKRLRPLTYSLKPATDCAGAC